MQTLEEILARDARAVSGEEPYEILWELTQEGGFIPHRLQPDTSAWENEGGR